MVSHQVLGENCQPALLATLNKWDFKKNCYVKGMKYFYIKLKSLVLPILKQPFFLILMNSLMRGKYYISLPSHCRFRGKKPWGRNARQASGWAVEKGTQKSWTPTHDVDPGDLVLCQTVAFIDKNLLAYLFFGTNFCVWSDFFQHNLTFVINLTKIKNANYITSFFLTFNFIT